MSFEKQIENAQICRKCEHLQVHGSWMICAQPGRPVMAPLHSGHCPIGRLIVIDASAILEDYIPQASWGAATWRRIHTLTAVGDEQLATIVSGLPCGECRDEAELYIKQHAPAFGADWRRWTWRWHNATSRRIGKPVITWMAFEALYPVMEQEALNVG